MPPNFELESELSTITHIGVWTPYVNEPTESALRMLRHIDDVKKFSEGYIVVFAPRFRSKCPAI
jgi:hypothetical protein